MSSASFGGNNSKQPFKVSLQGERSGIRAAPKSPFAVLFMGKANSPLADFTTYVLNTLVSHLSYLLGKQANHYRLICLSLDHTHTHAHTYSLKNYTT